MIMIGTESLASASQRVHLSLGSCFPLWEVSLPEIDQEYGYLLNLFLSSKGNLHNCTCKISLNI